MHELLLKKGSTLVAHDFTLVVRFSIHFYGIFCVDDVRDVLRSDGGDNTRLEMDMADRPGSVDRLDQKLNEVTGSKLKRTVSGNVDYLGKL